MMLVKDPASLQVALKVRGDAGRGRGGTQKFVDRVHSQPSTPNLGKEWCDRQESGLGQT